MLKLLRRVLLVWLVSTTASQAATVLQTGGNATEILDLDIGGTLYNVLFDYVTVDHDTLPGNGDIFMPTNNKIGADAVAFDIVTLLNEWSLNVATINSVGPMAETNFDIPYLYDTGTGCDDLCTSRGTKVIPTVPWGFTNATVGPGAPATFARFTPAPAAVPVPPALYLFGSGLIGLAGIARRRRLAV